MRYGINDKPATIKEWLLYAFQQCLSILTATILIATICGTSVPAGLVAGGMSTLVFLCITGFKCPLFISNSGATVSAVIGTAALSKSVEENCTGVVLGGLVICLMNAICALIIKKIGTSWVDKVFPPIIVGTAIMIIGINLMGFIPTYVQVNGAYSLLGIGMALFTMLCTVLYNHYGRGLVPTLSFLLGIGTAYVVASILTITGVAPLVNFEAFKNVPLFSVPDFSFLHLDFNNYNWSQLPNIILMYLCVNISAVSEHIGDILTASEITNEKLIDTVGLHRTLFADGMADLTGCLIGSQPTTTYGESLATIAVSKVASTRVIGVAALMTILLGFIGPFNALIVGMPNCLFGGISMVAYGYIALSGLKVLAHSNIDYDKSKNMLIFAVMLSLGTSGLSISVGGFNMNGVSLAIVIGILLNIVLR